MNQLRHVKQGFLSVGMIQDKEAQALKEGEYIRAINARLNSHEGQLPWIKNEPSNFSCLTLPLTIIGTIKLPSGRYAIFSTDDTESEIGTFDEVTCTYERSVRSACLGFKKSNLIRGVSKQNFDCSESIYFTDGLNPRRVFNFSHIPFTFTELNDECKTKVFTDQVDCDELLIDKKTDYPKITVELGTDGKLGNGSYQAAIAYAVNGEIATDWLGVTYPVKSFDHFPRGRSLDIKIENLDREFDEYSLAIIYTIDGVTAVDNIGVYSTAESHVVVYNVGKTATNNSLMSLDEIVAKRPVYGTADDVVVTSQHLLWTSPTERRELNYQPDAMNINIKWVAYKLPKNYYRNSGTIVGYMRDEVYTFGIQWLYPTGDWSPVYHIPGRKPLGRELRRVSGQDVYEKSSDICIDEELPFYFEVNNTAKLTKRYPNPASNFCDPALIAEGDMAYWQSSEVYADNQIFGDAKCTPIRHPKFPDSTVIHHHEGEIGITLGVKFDNIKQPEGVVGYRIVRGDRTGNRSVVAKGLLFNTGNYEDNQENWMYPNYPYNDLRSDPFLSLTQTKFNGNETDFNPRRANFNNNKFTFHSPSTSFNKPIIGTELKIESEEIAEIKGKFEEVYKHPKYKFITNFSFGIASAIAVGGALLAVKGTKCITAGNFPGGVDGAPRPFNYSVQCETALMGKIGFPGGTVPIPNIPGIIVAFGYYLSLGVQSVLNIIKLMANWQQFAYQYNSHGFYNNNTYARSGNRRRRINYGQYLIPGNQEINGVKMNNFNRESSVYLELDQPLLPPQTKDVSRNTISGFGMCNNPTGLIQSTGSSYYGAIKRKLPNQYGQLNAVRYLDTGVVQDISEDEFLISDHIFGGDTYVGRFTEKRKFNYFLLWPFDVPDGWEWDYRKYANVPYPRFWIDGTEYDLSSIAKAATPPIAGILGGALGGLLSLAASGGNSLGSLPSSKHNLDCYRNLHGVFMVKDRYFYLFNNGVIDYFAESEYNMDYRDWEEEVEGRHYDWHTYTNLKDLFRSDKFHFDNKFLFDKVYLKQLNENFIPKQEPSFDPNLTCNLKHTNRIIYSLPTEQEQVRDNWLIYPGLNYFDFGGENGDLITTQSFERDRLIFLFSKSGPYITLGVDTLQTDAGTKVLLGDGGLFAQRPQKLVDTKYSFGATVNKTWTKTQYGAFYPSANQGRIFRFDGGGLEDITMYGMRGWFEQNLPSKLLKDYPDFIHNDNTIVGVGLTSVFDSTNDVYYISKIDYKVKDEWKAVTHYDSTKDEWRVRGIKVQFKDPFIFEDASFTASFDPKFKAWISFHDWHPELTIQTDTTFSTTKDKAIWKHNILFDSYCNFYGQDYPFEIEFCANNGQQTSTLGSLEYSLECFRYKNTVDKYHLLDFNFDNLTIYNTEQISGLIKLEPHPDIMIDPFPIFNGNNMISSYSKLEQKYRINQFFDLTKDRELDVALMQTEPNGYRRIINKVAVDYGKLDKKKFRHNYSNIILRRDVCDDVLMQFKFIDEKETISTR